MPKLVNKKPGKRVNIYLTGEALEMWRRLDNGSKFVQLALQDAVGIMTWAILRKQDPEKYDVKDRPLEEAMEEFNREFPHDPLTAQRLNKQKTEEAEWPKSSPKKQELW